MGRDGLLTRDRGTTPFVCGVAFLYLDGVLFSNLLSFRALFSEDAKGNTEKNGGEMYVYVPDKNANKDWRWATIPIEHEKGRGGMM